MNASRWIKRLGSVVCATVLLTGVQAEATGTLFSVDLITDQLITLNTATGAGTAVGPVGFDNVHDLAFDPTTSTLFGVDFINGTGSQLITINTTTGVGTAVGLITPNAISGLAFDPTTSTMYGSDNNASRLITINTTTGAGTDVGFIGIANTLDLAFDPNTNTLFSITSSQLATLNTATGAGTIIGPFGGFGPVNLAFDPTTNTMFGGEVGSQLITINPATGAGTAIGPHGFLIFSLAFAPDSSPTSVPEPSTLLLLGTGLVGLVGYGRRKRRVKP